MKTVGISLFIACLTTTLPMIVCAANIVAVGNYREQDDKNNYNNENDYASHGATPRRVDTRKLMNLFSENAKRQIDSETRQGGNQRRQANAQRQGGNRRLAKAGRGASSREEAMAQRREEISQSRRTAQEQLIQGRVVSSERKEQYDRLKRQREIAREQQDATRNDNNGDTQNVVDFTVGDVINGQEQDDFPLANRAGRTQSNPRPIENMLSREDYKQLFGHSQQGSARFAREAGVSTRSRTRIQHQVEENTENEVILQPSTGTGTNRRYESTRQRRPTGSNV